MKFFDAKVTYGVPANRQTFTPITTSNELVENLERVGVSKALVSREEQFFSGPVTGNRLVAEDVKDNENLFAIWNLLPAHTHEVADPDSMLAEMKANRVFAWQFFPAKHRFTFHHRALKAWFELAETNRVPIMIDFSKGIGHADLLNVLERFPKLVLILSIGGVWPEDRQIRPILSEFPNVNLEISNYFGDGCVEELVEEIGSDRILFGSRFHQYHFGAIMLMLKHAQITETERDAIASKNLERILGDISYD